MKRKAMQELQAWKTSETRKPLLIQGARQTGKSYTMLEFGQQAYRNMVYVNLEESLTAQKIFEEDLNPKRIVRELSAYYAQTILPHETLIIMDEIQSCERALTSLKYFCEQANEYHVMAAGSLLGVALKREAYSFPVGKVDFMTMHPLDFEEFLWACDQTTMADLIRESYEACKEFSLHEQAIQLYQTYLMVGGMPASVLEYQRSRDLRYVRVIQNNLNDSYIADMAKYASPTETKRIMAAWNSIPAQLTKENHKFQYKVIGKNARASEYKDAVDWMVSAGIVNACILTKEGKLPLKANEDPDSYKLYMVDTGLLCSKMDIPEHVFLSSMTVFDGFKGLLTENYICQVLRANGIHSNYWTKQAQAELDFVYQDQEGWIIPVEVKANRHGKATSLMKFMKQYDCAYGIRFSAKNFGFEHQIKSIPLYAAFCVR